MVEYRINKKKNMEASEIAKGKKVWYYPIMGGKERKEAIITSVPYAMCGTTCCKIDIMCSVVDIDNLKER